MKEIIERYGIRAKKSLGQNFLMDEKILDDIIKILPLDNQHILEVGPGFGALTLKILNQNPKSLTLVELDDFMVEILQDRIQRKELDIEKTEFSLIHQDILKTQIDLEDYFVVANIPYYITSPILQKFLYNQINLPKGMIILMQKEVGERICDTKSSILSLIVQKKCTTSQKIFVPSGAFSPPPKVDSVVLEFIPHGLYNDVNDTDYLIFIKQAFSNPRKKMINNLVNAGYHKGEIYAFLGELGFGENTRAEELNVQNFIFLFKKLRTTQKSN